MKQKWKDPGSAVNYQNKNESKTIEASNLFMHNSKNTRSIMNGNSADSLIQIVLIEMLLRQRAGSVLSQVFRQLFAFIFHASGYMVSK